MSQVRHSSPLPVLVNVARPRGEADTVQLAREALDAGLSGLCFADSPRLFPDPVVESTRVLAAVDSVLAGPCVLSLPLVHVAKAASALSTVAAHHPGRLVAVVGRGESSLANEGLRPPRLREYAASLASLSSRLAHERRAMRLLGAASGPRTIEVTARELGGVLLDVGTSPTAVQAAARLARAVDAEASVWAFLRVSITEDATDAEAISAPLIGSCASRMVTSPGWYGVPQELSAAVAELADAHDYLRHGTSAALRDRPPDVGDPHLAEAADLVRDRFVLVGPTEAVAQRLRELRAAGIAGVILAGGLPGVLDRLRELGSARLHASAPRPDRMEVEG